MLKIFSSVLGVTFTCLLACNKPNPSANISNAAIMFMNATETGKNIEPLDGKVDNDTVTGSAHLNTLSACVYRQISTGTKDLSFWFTGGSRLLDTSEIVEFNQHYSVFAVGPLSASWEVITFDDLNKGTDGCAKVRFANFCSSNPRLYFAFGGKVIDSPQFYYDPYYHRPYVSEFEEIPEGTGQLYAKDIHNTGYGAVIGTQTFAAGHIYTVIFADSSTNGTSGFYLTVVNNY